MMLGDLVTATQIAARWLLIVVANLGRNVAPMNDVGVLFSIGAVESNVRGLSIAARLNVLLEFPHFLFETLEQRNNFRMFG